MQKKEFFSVLLLVSLASAILLAGISRSTVGPSISVYPSTGITASSDVYVYVTGSGWNSGAPVTLYWDQQSDNHTIAIMTPSTSGTFRLNQLEIERVPIGVHKIIAVQGVNTATCTYTVTATMPPDETLLDAIQQVENSMGNTQSNFTTVISGLGDIENKLDNTTSGLPGIQSNLTQIDSDVNAVEGKLDPSGRLGNTTQMSSKNGHYISMGGSPYVITCSASETAEFTITFAAISNISGSTVRLVLYSGNYWSTVSDTPVPSNGYEYFVYSTSTVAANGIRLDWGNSAPASLAMDWWITVQAPPGTTITFS